MARRDPQDMKRASHLFGGVIDFDRLCTAARRAARGKRPTWAMADFMMNLEPEVLQLRREILAGAYHPRPYRVFRIRDPKPRTISAAAFRDRVVHHALCAALEPVFERCAIADSYACRPGRGQHAAIRRTQQLARRWPWFQKLDVAHFFETAHHGVLAEALRRKIKDARLLALTQVFIDAGASGSAPGCGLPIGNLTSQHFANFYLTPLDRHIKQTLGVSGYVRYMDDLLLFGPDKASLVHWTNAIEAFVTESLRLALRPEAARRGPVSTGVPYLGFRIWPHLIRFDGARARRFRRRCRALEAGSSPSGGVDPQRAMESLVGWSTLGNTARFRASFFARLDKQSGDL